MHVSRISAHEAEFARTGVDSNGRAHALRRTTVETAGEPGSLSVVEVTSADGDTSFYHPPETLKDQVVLHFTMGYLQGDMAALTTPGRAVSVAYLIARNGTIYNLFPSSCWSYHLGKGSFGGNTERSRASVAIELSNIGPLRRIGDQIVTSYGDTDVYCTTGDTEHYRRTERFRDFEYFATFPELQLQSLISLLRHITGRHGIPRSFLDDGDRYRAFAEVADFRGIVSHVNYRPSGKVDIGPAFDWQRVIAAVTSK